MEYQNRFEHKLLLSPPDHEFFSHESKLHIQPLRITRSQDGSDVSQLRVFGDAFQDELSDPLAAMIGMDDHIAQPTESDAVGDKPGAADGLALE